MKVAGPPRVSSAFRKRVGPVQKDAGSSTADVRLREFRRSLLKAALLRSRLGLAWLGLAWLGWLHKFFFCRGFTGVNGQLFGLLGLSVCSEGERAGPNSRLGFD